MYLTRIVKSFCRTVIVPPWQSRRTRRMFVNLRSVDIPLNSQWLIHMFNASFFFYIPLFYQRPFTTDTSTRWKTYLPGTHTIYLAAAAAAAAYYSLRIIFNTIFVFILILRSAIYEGTFPLKRLIRLLLFWTIFARTVKNTLYATERGIIFYTTTETLELGHSYPESEKKKKMLMTVQ